MEKIKTLNDFKLHGCKNRVHYCTGIIYDIDEECIYVLEMLMRGKWFHSCGERYKLKHNFTQDEINKIEAGTYISFSVKQSTEYIEFQKIGFKKAKVGHSHEEWSVFEILG